MNFEKFNKSENLDEEAMRFRRMEAGLPAEHGGELEELTGQQREELRETLARLEEERNKEQDEFEKQNH
ncbi:hypothetical protein COU49_00990 [Candidatus Nomurabacteria bacterium CG10_big_fil_rev_8_21_14_0_10_35_16]|uniref:Uncharacterized protein n=1 Tax=Candidatus Nomurabacteria bacterium CG10_big_fil_rev_8_21_14_0_10_35_16 TaxID=1974731 RepID=A0A2H0TDR3_9BACT|nr:MAG: hypothetical protein COU49_00990 [Candidatus Nomurabacteria bacterium CG10_big_fil_rev_8_21_14_0_10_35_16]